MGIKDSVRSVLNHKGGSICSVAPNTRVYDALAIMADKDIGAVLVVWGSQLRGVFSERDYARKVILHGKASKDITVEEIMSSPPIVAMLDQSVDDCLHLMTKFRVRHLPVLDGEKVVGVLSIGDLVNWIIDRQGEEIQQLHQYIHGSYPA